MLSRNDLHPYQLQAIQFIKDTPSCALWLDMGLGKTISTLSAIKDLLESGDASRVLIIAPLRVAVSTWPNEGRRTR
jgi:SNF2 family DNA or RNA helicase